MKYQIIIRPEAEQDIKELYQWYEEQSIGLGSEFFRCIESVLDYIEFNPKMYQKIYKNVRRALTSRFPVGIFYILKKDKIIVLAVLSAKRDPQLIKDRS